MVVAASWDAPDAGVIAAFDAASKLGDPSDPDLDPEKQGTNIEALGARGGELLIGFRNPLPGGRAIVVSLRNPAAAIAGAAPRFGGAASLDLAGLGIRDLAWSEAHGRCSSSPARTTAARRSCSTSGAACSARRRCWRRRSRRRRAAEAVVPYPGTKDVQILFDQGNALVDPATACKDAPAAMRRFADAIVHVD